MLKTDDAMTEQCLFPCLHDAAAPAISLMRNENAENQIDIGEGDLLSLSEILRRCRCARFSRRAAYSSAMRARAGHDPRVILLSLS